MVNEELEETTCGVCSVFIDALDSDIDEFRLFLALELQRMRDVGLDRGFDIGLNCILATFTLVKLTLLSLHSSILL